MCFEFYVAHSSVWLSNHMEWSNAHVSTSTMYRFSHVLQMTKYPMLCIQLQFHYSVFTFGLKPLWNPSSHYYCCSFTRVALALNSPMKVDMLLDKPKYCKLLSDIRNKDLEFFIEFSIITNKNPLQNVLSFNWKKKKKSLNSYIVFWFSFSSYIKYG